MSEIGPLLSLAAVLTVGLVGGELVTRIRIPRVTGWILTGVLLRALSLDAFSPARLADFAPLTNFVLAYIAFTVGSHLHLKRLINAQKRLLLLLVTEAVVTPAIVIFFMNGVGGVPIAAAALFAAIAVAGAPGTTVIVIREARARGVFVKTLVAGVALIDLVAVCLFVVFDEAPPDGGALSLNQLLGALPSLAKTVAVAVGVGLGCAGLVILLTRAIVGPRLLGASLVAAMLMAWGLADWLGASSILAVTFLGAALANLIADKERAGEAYLNTFSSVLFTAFYTLAGLRLDFSLVLPVAGLVALFFGSRLLGKALSAFTAMSLAGAPKQVRTCLGLALLPHGGVAVGLIIAVQADPALAEYSDLVLSVGLAALAINQLVGPSATRWTLGRVGEAGLDRPRLLDFIREQDIVTNLQAKSREEAFTKLVDQLFRTHDVHSSKEEFLQSVLTQDNIESSCLGEGLMIPHGRVEIGDELAGVIGISRKGFDWDTPDGRPVHAIVLLATPRSQSDRHLEVLAAFANAIGKDRNIREQLYHADTAAHAYNILHAGDAEDFNYFVEDTLSEEEAPRAPAKTTG